MFANSAFASPPEFLWGRSTTNNEYDYAFSTAVDGSSNVFVAGVFKSQTQFGSTVLTGAEEDDVFLAKFDSVGNLMWSTNAGGPGYDMVKGLAVDASGDVYMTGNFQVSAAFGATTLIGPNTGYQNTFVAKYSATGIPLWAKSVSGPYNLAASITVDGQTNIITTGINGLGGTATFNTITLTNSGSYVAKYDREGNVLWAKVVEASTGGEKGLQPFNIAVDTNLNIFMAGLEDDRNSPPATNAFLLKLDSGGNFVWGVTNGRPCELCGARTYGTSVAVDTFGNSYLGGVFRGNPKFGPTNLTTTAANAGFVAKYDPNGNLLWVQQAASGTGEFYHSAWFGSIKVDPDGNLIAAGGFFGNVSMADGAWNLNSTGDDIFVVVYDPAGSVTWATNSAGSNSEYVTGIALDASGDGYMVGQLSGTMTFGSDIFSLSGLRSAFVLKFGTLNAFMPPIFSSALMGRTVVAPATATFAVSVTSVSPVTYQWFKDGIQIPGAGASLQVNATNETNGGIYSVVATNSYGAATNSARLTVVFRPAITTGPQSQSVDIGDPVTFSVLSSGTTPLRYEWRLGFWGDTISTNSSLSLTNVQPEEAGTYFVTVFNAYGSADASAVLTVNSAPAITSDPQGKTVFAGSNVTFQVNATGKPLFYQWLFNNASISSATSSSLILPNVRTNNSGTYSVIVSNHLGTATSADATLTVTMSAPVIVSEPANRTVFAEANVTISVTATGAPPPAYQWQFNQTNIPGATSSAFLLPNITTNQAGPYRVTVSNEVGLVTSQTATLTILPALTLAEALDGLGLVWTKGGDTNWIAQTNVTHDGVDAAQSGAIAHSRQTWIETTVAGPGTLTFWWKVSSESGFDYLEFYTNGVRQTGISGEATWQQRSYTLESGSQTLRWRYLKDSSAIAGQDKGWVDEVVFTSSAPQPFTLSAPQRLGDGSFRWMLNGESGRSYTIQTSTNLSVWDDLRIVVPDNTSFQINDTNAPAYPQRFYRMRSP